MTSTDELKAAISTNQWTKEELDVWFDTLATSLQNQILEILEDVADDDQNVLRVCNLLREELEKRDMVLTQLESNYAMASAVWNGFQQGVIQWRLFSGNLTTKSIFF